MKKINRVIHAVCFLRMFFIFSGLFITSVVASTDSLTMKSTEDSTSLKTQKEVKSTIKVTFIELGSDRCIPCKMMQPVLKAIEQDYGTQVKVVFYDVWTPQGEPHGKRYGIKAIPTQIFLDDTGKEYYRHSGYFPKEEVVKILKLKGVN